MKFKKILHVVWLACALLPQIEGKVVGNIKDDDGGTLTIVNIEDDNKTHYYNQNFEVGNYNYGYDVKPSGPVGQFHHENKSPAEVVYGCYGYEGPDTKNHMTFYVSDAWGYRPVKHGQDLEIFYPADNPPGTGHMNGQMVKWQDLVFPEMCTNIGDRLASSSNVVTNQPIQPAFVTGLPSTAAPSPLAVFTGKASTVPQGSFDIIPVNVPSTIGPQPGRLSTVGTFTGGVTSSAQLPQEPVSSNIVPGRTVSSPAGPTGGPSFGNPSSGSPSSGFTGFPSSTRFGQSATPTTSTRLTSPSGVSSAGTTRGSPFSGGVVSTGAPGFSGGVVSTGAPGFSGGVVSTGGPGFSGGLVSTGAPGFSGGVVSTGAPGFSGGVVSSGAPSSSTQPDDFEAEVDSQSSNNGALRPNRPNRPISTTGPGATPSTGSNRNSSPFGSNTQFSRLVPTPTEPALGSSGESGSSTGGFSANPSASLSSNPTTGFSNNPQSSRFPTTRAPTTLNFNFRTTTTSSPAATTGFTGPASSRVTDAGVASSLGPSGPSSTRVTVPAAPKQPSYGSPDEDYENISSNDVSLNPVSGSSASTRGPSRGSQSTGSGRIPTNSLSTGAPTGIPTGSSPFTPQPSSSSGPSSTRGNSQTSTNYGNTISFSPTATTASLPGSTGFRPSSGFSGNFNNPSTLQPSSSNQQTIPGGPTSTSFSGVPSSFGTTGTSGAPPTFGPSGSSSSPTGFSSAGTPTPSRLSSSSRQPLSTSGFSQPFTGAPTLPSSTAAREPSTFTAPSRSPVSTNFPNPTASQLSSRPPTTSLPIRNTSVPSDSDFCSTQCGSCASSNPPPPPPTHSQPPSDEDFLRIPGALMSQVPVIFYPDCSANAYTRPAIVPFCPSSQTQGANGNQPSLSMRFPDTSSFLVTPGGPIARNAFVGDHAASASVRVARKVRRGPRQQRPASH